MKLYPTILSSFLLTGCMVSHGAYYHPQVAQVPTQEIAQKSQFTKSEFDKCTEVVGAEVISNPEYFSMDVTSYSTHLRSWLCKPARHQLYITIEYPWAWRFYTSATDANAQAASLTQIASDVTDCTNGTCHYSEVLGIDLSESALKRGAKEGLKYQLRAKSGDKTIIDVPANVVKGYLESLTLKK